MNQFLASRSQSECDEDDPQAHDVAAPTAEVVNNLHAKMLSAHEHSHDHKLLTARYGTTVQISRMVHVFRLC